MIINYFNNKVVQPSLDREHYGRLRQSVSNGMKAKFLKWSFLLLVFTIPFGTKKFIYAFAYSVSEFNSIFLYGSDILLVLFLALFFLWLKERSDVLKNVRIFFKKEIFILAFIFFAILSVFLASYKLLALSQVIRLFLLVLMAFAVGLLLKEGIVEFKHVMTVIAASSVFQALVAILQFKFFKSLGLWLLGEPVVNVFTENIARFRIDDLIFLRSFGTMPHANILATFLVLGLLGFYYLWLRNSERYEKTKKIFLAIGIFLVSLALVFTFSRSGWIIAAVVAFLSILWGLINKTYRKKTLQLLVIVIVVGYLLLANFNWLVLPRAQLSASEPSVNYRWLYNEIGWHIIKNNPLSIGIGNQLLYALNNNLYQQFGIIRQIDWQPVHNIYLLMASEIGIIGLLSFLLFLYYVVLKNSKFEVQNSKQIQNASDRNLKPFRIWDLENWKLFRDSNLEIRICKAMLLALLGVGLVDHFPWTLQNGRFMLWLAIGLVLGSKFLNNKRETI